MSGAEVGAILDVWHRSDEQGQSAVLATVVHVRGSAYRRPGARMLILPDGTRIGSVSGGCLEGDLVRKAWWSTAGERPVVRVFDTSSQDDAIWEFGLGCNGVVHVLLERTGAPATRAVRAFIEECRGRTGGGVLATVVRVGEPNAVDIGQRLFVNHVGDLGVILPERLWRRSSGGTWTPCSRTIRADSSTSKSATWRSSSSVRRCDW